MDLTFGEQVKIILRRKGMTIKELAEIIEETTGKKMSRQNLTQRLGRDNFQEQDMRMIAGILDCPFHLNILDEDVFAEEDSISKETTENIDEKAVPVQEEADTEIVAEEKPSVRETSFLEREITIGELVEEAFDDTEDVEEEVFDDIEEEVFNAYDESGALMEEILEEMEALERESHERRQEKENRTVFEDGEKKTHGWRSYLTRIKKKVMEEPVWDIVKKEESTEAEDGIFLDEIFRTETVDLDDEFLDDELENEEFTEEPKEQQLQEEVEYYMEEEFEKNSGNDEEDMEIGDVNPYTGHEYMTNSVRMHPRRIGYVQVYDRGEHKWMDMTEWAFLGYQERKKVLLGKDYDPPIYLD